MSTKYDGATSTVRQLDAVMLRNTASPTEMRGRSGAGGEDQRHDAEDDGKAERRHHRKSADQRHRHGGRRDQRCPPVLQEQHDHHENEVAAMKSVFYTSSIEALTNFVVSNGTE